MTKRAESGSHATRMWGGRFGAGAGPGEAFRALGDSLRFDWRLVREDVAGSIAWAGALREAGALTPDEAASLRAALHETGAKAAAFTAPPIDSGAEDVHSWVEGALIARVGALGKKLHTGRSRNDQVATDMRLWLREEGRARLAEIHALQKALVDCPDDDAVAPFPGYTHVQRAQPITYAHWRLSHVEALERDADRLRDALTRQERCPLGSGALAGTAYPVDRARLARALGFDGPTRNSLDAVGDRDFVAEALFALALCAVHLSRLAEDIVLYTSAEFGLLELSDDVTSGSSLMPQKKNPDAAELVRGRCGRAAGALVAILTTLKGAPSSYNRDFQEDKEPLFDAMDSLSLCLRAMTATVAGAKLRRARALEAAQGGHANATELADYLVDKGAPFRDAHDLAGRAVRLAIERGCALEALPPADLRAISPAIGTDVVERLSVSSALSRRDVLGGTAPRRVAQALARARRRLQATSPPPADVRIRKARVEDADEASALINAWAKSGANIARSPDDVARHARDFSVAVDAGAEGLGVVACGALVLMGDRLAEIRSLAVDERRTGRGVGSAVVRKLCSDAQAIGSERVFVLTCSPAFFTRLGFEPVSVEALGAAGKAAWARRDRAGAQWSFLVWECEA